MIDRGLALPAPKQKHVSNTLSRPLKRRKSVRLAWIRGILGNSEGNISQPVEIHDSGDKQPPRLEGVENEK